MSNHEMIVFFTDREQKDFAPMAKWFQAFGIGMLIVGFLAVILPHIATLTVQVLIAIILLLSGGLHIAHAFMVRKWRAVTWEVLMAALFILTGMLFIVYPMSGAFVLTLMLGVFFLIAGIFKISSALTWRQRPGWVLMLISGLLSVILGMIVIFGLPGTALWVIGLLLGIDLIFSGITLLVLGRSVKGLSNQVP